MGAVASGVYEILCLVNNKSYIGSSVNLYKRWREHYNNLLNNRHSNQYLQNSFNKYGENQFVFSVLEYCEPENLIDREQYYIDKMDTVVPNGFNMLPRAGSRFGYSLSKETRDKISKSNKGRKLTESARKEMSRSRKGRKLSQATIDKISGKNHWLYGKHRSDTVKARIGSKNSKPVMQLDPNTAIVIATYSSALEAEHYTGINSSGISQCCSGVRKTAGGFVWKHCIKNEVL